MEPVHDLDGPSKAEQDNCDDTILSVVIEQDACRREGCDAADRHRYYYTMNGVEDVEELLSATVNHVTFDTDVKTVSEDLVSEFIYQSNTTIRPEDPPTLEVDNVTTITPSGSNVERSELGGRCTGVPLDPR
jgi:hypothetical protein